MSECCKGTSASRRAGHALGLFVLASLVAGLVSCATREQFSYLYGDRWVRSELDTYDTVILAVDGHSYTYNDRIRVEPGEHHIFFDTLPSSGFSFSPRKELVLNVEPCTRYYFEAKRQNNAQQDFELRVNYKEPIPGCGTMSASAAEPERRMGGY